MITGKSWLQFITLCCFIAVFSMFALPFTPLKQTDQGDTAVVATAQDAQDPFAGVEPAAGADSIVEEEDTLMNAPRFQNITPDALPDDVAEEKQL